jgi:hypothetical protein
MGGRRDGTKARRKLGFRGVAGTCPPIAALPGRPPFEGETVREQDVVELGSELSFPASDPPAYMGSGTIAGPPIRDRKKPEEPMISEGGDPHDSPTGTGSHDDSTDAR